MKIGGWLFGYLVLGCLVLESKRATGQRRQGPGGPAGANPPPTVRLPQGTISGREVFLSRTQRVTQYLGIPYAQPPINQLRFAAPVTDPMPTWTGTRNATSFGPSCPQATGRRKLHERLYLRLLPNDQPDPGRSEDCLFLNIYVPDGARPTDGWPVMVWFHGGDFNTGTPAIWDASVFVAKQKVLVVTVAYRLNILGFFTTADGESPGNYGLLDQIAALNWVNQNIELFDGSASNVCIYGHSAGAISVGLHMMSPLSRGKFSKAIAMSGDAISSVRMPQQELPVIDEVADKFGCYRNTDDLMECLRNVEIDILIRETAEIETWGPIVDADTNNWTGGPFLPKHPRDIVQSADELFAVPLVAGFTSNEQALAYIESIGSENVDGRLPQHQFEGMIRDESSAAVVAPDENSTCELRPDLVTDAVLFFYRPYPPTKDQKVFRDKFLDLQTEKNYAAGLTQLATKVSSHSSRGAQAYVYRFDYRARTQAVTRDVPDWAGVPHMFELPFVWGVPYATGSPIQWNAADKKMADVMMSLVAAFARTGNPSVSTVKWEPYTDHSPGVLVIERNIEMSDYGAVDYRALAFWNDYYPTVLDAAINNCCNATNAVSAWRLINLKSASFGLAVLLSLLRLLDDRRLV